MKQFLFLLVLTSFGMFASFWWTPYAGVALYYWYAVLRPQYLWQWQLEAAPVTLPWSFLVASAALGGYLCWAGGLMTFGRLEQSLMRYRPKFTAAHWLMMAFAFWVCLSFVFSNDREHSEAWFGEYLKIFAMYFLASRVVRTPKQIWGLYMLVMFALAYIAWEMNVLYLTTGRLDIARRGFAGLDNNGAGLMLALGVPLCYFAWEFTRGWYRWVFLAMVPVVIHTVLFSYSRGAMLAMLAAVPFYFLYSRKKRFLVLVALGIAAALPVMAGKEIQARFFSVEKREQDDSWKSRMTSWRIAVEIAMDYPLVGAGVRCSNAEMKARGGDMENRTIHSQYLQLAADSGWPALGLYVAMVVATFYAIWRARLRLWPRTDPESVRAVAMLGGLECAIISFLVGALALSLEVFEIAYLFLLLGAQVWGLINATDTAAHAPLARLWSPGPPAPVQPVTGPALPPPTPATPYLPPGATAPYGS
jgi:probable O-glycosylation ligase (exosortase A-associated)